MALGKFTVTGTFRQYNGAPHQGYVRIISAPVQDPDARRTLLGGAPYPLDRLGHFTASLPATGVYELAVHLRKANVATKTLTALAAGLAIDWTDFGSGSTTVASTLALDTDGVYYYAPGAGTFSILTDTDGVPYVSGAGIAGGTLAADTDGVPYLA